MNNFNTKIHLLHTNSLNQQEIMYVHEERLEKAILQSSFHSLLRSLSHLSTLPLQPPHPLLLPLQQQQQIPQLHQYQQLI
ncbi:hypothetical protein Hanom_Chr04g00310311 [Helianthus anomalus]